MTPARVRLVSLLAPGLLGALALLTWTQPWVDATLVEGPLVTVAGDVAAPALPALALAMLALVAALALAGRVFRIVLGLLLSLLGAAIATSAALVLAQPVAAAGPAVTELTGVEGADSVAALVASAALTPWPGIALVVGALGVVTGILVAALSGRWPERTRRYDAVRLEQSGAADATPAARDRFDDWDALSDGRDPTDQGRMPGVPRPSTQSGADGPGVDS